MENIDTEQLECMQRFINQPASLLSDNEAKVYQDLWSSSMNREKRQDLYRYWLCTYIQLLTGLESLFRTNFVFFLLRKR